MVIYFFISPPVCFHLLFLLIFVLFFSLRVCSISTCLLSSFSYVHFIHHFFLSPLELNHCFQRYKLQHSIRLIRHLPHLSHTQAILSLIFFAISTSLLPFFPIRPLDVTSHVGNTHRHSCFNPNYSTTFHSRRRRLLLPPAFLGSRVLTPLAARPPKPRSCPPSPADYTYSRRHSLLPQPPVTHVTSHSPTGYLHSLITHPPLIHPLIIRPLLFHLPVTHLPDSHPAVSGLLDASHYTLVIHLGFNYSSTGRFLAFVCR